MRRVFLLLCFFLCGCVSYQGLPSSWEDIEKHDRTDDCLSIAGTYKNQGEYPDGSPVYLTTLLIPEKNRQGPRYTTAVLEKADTIKLERHKNASFLMRITGENLNAEKLIDRSKGHYRCAEGIMQMDHMSADHDSVMPRSGMTQRQIYRSGDWLYIKSAGMAMTLLLVIPLNEYEYRWARFPIHAAPEETARDETAP